MAQRWLEPKGERNFKKHVNLYKNNHLAKGNLSKSFKNLQIVQLLFNSSYSSHFCVCSACEITLRGLREKLKHKIRYIDDNAEQNNAKETPSKVSILSGHGTEDDDNDPDDKDLKSNQKSAKSGDLCIEIKLGKIILSSSPLYRSL